MHKEDGSLTCPDCRKTFTEYTNISHEEEMFSCTVCNKRFTGRDQLKTHVADHPETTDLMCQDCGEKCNRDDNLRGHVKRMHKEVGNLTCPDCRKTFTEYTKIRKYIEPMQEEKRFSCTFCGQSLTGGEVGKKSSETYRKGHVLGLWREMQQG